MFHVATLLTALLSLTLLPSTLSIFGRLLGWRLRKSTQSRRDLLIARTSFEHKQAASTKTEERTTLDEEWEKVDRSRSRSSNGDVSDDSFEGIIGFFHPFCNAGGGGERVLWAALRATQRKYPNAICIVYTGDHDVSKAEMLARAQKDFNISLTPSHIHFLYPTTRFYVNASTWPNFTLLGQAIGSMILAYDALSLLTPDIFIDTMGYAFAIFLCTWLLPNVPAGAYVHYPTISLDMLGSLDVHNDGSGRGGVHAGRGRGWKGTAKKVYWRLFAALYRWVGGHVDTVMTNSSWTQNHIMQLWELSRRRRKGDVSSIEVVYPPCAVDELEREIKIDEQEERKRTKNCVYIAQFRPEKNHQLVLRAFAKLLQQMKVPAPAQSAPASAVEANSYNERKHPHLTLIGSVRDSTDETHVYSLRLLAHELRITHAVTFLLRAPWSAVLDQLRTASVGINAMWNEHFGIGVVEYQAAGLISVVNDSGGPKNDIVCELKENGPGGPGPTGFHALMEQQYADQLEKALTLQGQELLDMRLRARRSARRFNEAAFEERWLKSMSELVALRSRNPASTCV